MCLVINEQKYHELIYDATWMDTVPEKLEAFNSTLMNAANDETQKRRIADHGRKVEEFDLIQGVQGGL